MKATERVKTAKRRLFSWKNSIRPTRKLSWTTLFLLSFLPFLASLSYHQPRDPSQIPEPQIAYALHASWDPDLTDDLPSVCTTSGEVAVPWFHFYAGWKDGAPAFFSVDWVLIEELTNLHPPQRWYFESPQKSSDSPYGCTMVPVSDPQNWNWTVWSFAPMLGFSMHNTSYKVTVQWRYGVYMKGPRGPFQTSITIDVQNLVVTSPDETKVLKWDSFRGINDTTFSYSLECAQRKVCSVRISIYETDGTKVYEEQTKKVAPGTYSFSWNGKVNQPLPEMPSDGLAPPGFYAFDIEVIGIAPGYDQDRIRSQRLRISEHEIIVLAHDDSVQTSYSVPDFSPVQAWYLLRGVFRSSRVLIEVYDPNFQRSTSVSGTTKTIPEEVPPNSDDWNIVNFSVSFALPSSFYPYTFVFWAWDGNWEYKNHLPKTTFNNSRLRYYTGAHFMGSFGLFGFGLRMTSHTKAVKELREVRYWIINPQRQRILRKVDYGEFWWWTDPANAQPPNQPTNFPKTYQQPSALGSRQWNKVFRALECTTVVSLFGHGNWKAMGPTERRAILNAQDLLRRYSSWYCWNVSKKQWIAVRGLGHLRLVLLLGCNTGGAVYEDNGQIFPQPGSLADTFKNLGVQCVVYLSDRGFAPVTDEWAKYFGKLPQKNVSVSPKPLKWLKKDMKTKIGLCQDSKRVRFNPFMLSVTHG